MGDKQMHFSADSPIHMCVYIMLNINLWANYVASKRLELFALSVLIIFHCCSHRIEVVDLAVVVEVEWLAEPQKSSLEVCQTTLEKTLSVKVSPDLEV